MSATVPPRRRRRPTRVLVAALCVAGGMVVGAGVTTWAGQHYRVYAVTGSSMQPGLDPEERVVVALVDPSSPDIGRGDVVVFPDPGTWADHAERSELGAGQGTGDGTDDRAGATRATVVKRVVAVEGERVVCCSRSGQLVVDGVPLDEPYLHPSAGRFASALAFDVVVPEGTVWVLGDHRAVSRDSRFDPQGEHGGAVAVDDVIGVVRAEL